MYVPAAFRVDDPETLRAIIRDARLASLVTATADGLLSTPLPLVFEPDEGDHGTLYGHVARANPQWKTPVTGEALVIFLGPDAYISPSFYPSKQEHGKVVPTWNYAAVHAYGPPEFFEDADRLLELVTRLTDRHEHSRAEPWAVTDAPEPFIRSQIKGIVGVRIPITRIEAKLKMSQNRSAEDRAGVVHGLAASDIALDRIVAGLIPVDRE